MKVVCSDKIINLDKFESVQYRASLLGDGYPVEATRHETGGRLFGGVATATEEIARFPHECTARALVSAIAESWLANEQVFDVKKWKVEKAPAYTPASESNSPSEKHLQMAEALLSLEDVQEKTCNQIKELE